MSSNDHKKFKTDATQKASTDTEIISDAIILPPYSTDHILTVTAPTSTSGLTGQVDVELEMSPDGENWCPVKVLETTTTEGTTGETSIENANLKAVSTLPDATAQSPETSMYRNKFALGSLSYDDAGAETAVGFGTRDFMHQFISKDKPFNYSLWYKMDTNTQDFADDYSPVLFRHGGKDIFTNEKTIELTDTSGTYFNEYAIEANPIGTGHGLYQNDSFMLGVDTTYGVDTGDGGITRLSSSVSFWFKNPTQYASLFEMRGASSSNKLTSFGLAFHQNNKISILIHVTTGNAQAIIIDTSQNVWNSGWNHVVLNILPQGGTNFYWELFINGGASNGGSTFTTSSLTVPLLSASNSISNHAFGVLGQWYGSVPPTVYYPDETPVGDGGTGPMAIDEFAVWNDSLTETQANAMYNGAAPTDLTGSANLHRYYRFGDGPNDIETSIEDLVTPGATDAITRTASGTNYIKTLNPTTDGSMYVTPDKITQNLCEPLSTAAFLNEYYLQGSSSTSISSDDFYASSKTIIHDPLNNSYMPYLADAFTISGWFQVSSTTTQEAIFLQTGQAGYGLIQVFANSNGTIGFTIRHSFGINADSSYTSATIDMASNNIPINTWIHFVARKPEWDQDPVTSAWTAPGANATMTSPTDLTLRWLDTNNVVQTATSSGTTTVGGGISGYGWREGSNYISSLHMASALKSSYNLNNYRNNSSVKIDEISGVPLEITDQQSLDLFNGGVIIDPSTVTGSSTQTHYRMGDGTNDDVANSSVSCEISNQVITARGTIPPSLQSLSTTESIYSGANPVFDTLFTATSNFSISGWFKTIKDDTGVLFSNTEGAASSGMKLDVNDLNMTLSFLDTPESISINSDVNDGSWHHILVTKNDAGINQFTIYVDGSQVVQASKAVTDNDLKGSNGFTLLGDGSNNANNALTATSIDASKLNATLSNWSIHSEVLDEYAAKQLYSNGHVRNIKNLPSVDPLAIEAWWQLNDQTTPEQDTNDTVNGVDLQYQDGNSPTETLVNQLVDADGATAIAEEDQYGSGITMSITRRFDIVNNEWTNVHTHAACICLSFNGFEDQAEYFAIYTTSNINIADNNWHNTALCFSGKEGSTTTATQNFCFDTLSHNFVVSVDGVDLTSAHFVGGLGGPITNKCFPAEERHLKFVTNDQEIYMPHCQLNSNIFLSQPSDDFLPVEEKDYKTAFIGYADESSFHSESWFTDANGNPQSSFNDQKTATLYGNTSTLSNRGVNSTVFVEGTPYPLRRPSVIGASPSTGNQYIDPEKYNASTNPNGGLEAWWRWGDTVGDCSENINDAIGFESSPVDGHRSLKARAYVSTEYDPDGEGGLEPIPRDLIYLSETDSIYVAGEETTGTTGGTVTQLVDAVLENIQAGVCNLKNLTSPILQYIRIKYTNNGEAQLGEDKVETSIHYRKRRER